MFADWPTLAVWYVHWKFSHTDPVTNALTSKIVAVNTVWVFDIQIANTSYPFTS